MGLPSINKLLVGLDFHEFKKYYQNLDSVLHHCNKLRTKETYYDKYGHYVSY